MTPVGVRHSSDGEIAVSGFTFFSTAKTDNQEGIQTPQENEYPSLEGKLTEL
jgi:hypothetical protein